MLKYSLSHLKKVKTFFMQCVFIKTFNKLNLMSQHAAWPPIKSLLMATLCAIHKKMNVAKVLLKTSLLILSHTWMLKQNFHEYRTLHFVNTALLVPFHSFNIQAGLSLRKCRTINTANYIVVLTTAHFGWLSVKDVKMLFVC